VSLTKQGLKGILSQFVLEYARCFFLVAAFRFVEILPVETAVETTAEGANEMIEIQWRMVRWAFLL
jgi:hypothetical protein